MGKSKSRHKARAGKSQPLGEVRIIAGSWRGRKLGVVAAPGLRPTGDRVRETLFNWLSSRIRGSCCLDLFAGSGALGFEAASRGARSVRMIERNPQVVRQLCASATTLQADVQVVQGDGFEQLQLANEADIIFVDPPFDGTDYTALIRRLVEHTGKDTLIYLESPSTVAVALPQSCELLREKRFGEVTARLIRTGS